MGLPDFVIAGAAKAGTTSLWNYMREHPEICMAAAKEPIFFTRSSMEDENNPFSRRLTGRFDWGWEWYENLYEACPTSSIRGEGSTMYMAAPDSAGLIRAAAPDARLIFLLRDPVGRIQANHGQDARVFKVPPLAELMKQNHPQYEFYIQNSRYGEHLARFREHFPAEQILVHLNEDLRASARDVVRKSFEFVGADPTFVPETIDQKHNVSSVPRSRMLHKVLGIHYGRGPLPRRVEMVGRRVRRAVRLWNLKPATNPDVPDEVRADILSRLSDDLDRLEQIIERPLNAWRA